MSSRVRASTDLVERIVAILSENGRPVVLADEHEEYAVFVAMNKQEAFAHLVSEYGPSSEASSTIVSAQSTTAASPPKATRQLQRAPRSKMPSLLKVCPGRIEILDQRVDEIAVTQLQASVERTNFGRFVPSLEAPAEVGELAEAGEGSAAIQDSGSVAQNTKSTDEMELVVCEPGLNRPVGDSVMERLPEEPTSHVSAALSEPAAEEAPAEHAEDPPEGASTLEPTYIYTTTNRNRARLRQRRKAQEIEHAKSQRGPNQTKERSVKGPRTGRRLTKCGQKSTEAIPPEEHSQPVGVEDADNESSNCDSEGDGDMDCSNATTLKAKLWLKKAEKWLAQTIAGHSSDTVRQTSTTLQASMVRKASEVGSMTAMEELQDLLAYWRDYGPLSDEPRAKTALHSNLLDTHQPPSSAPPNMQGQSLSQAVVDSGDTRGSSRYKPEVTAFCEAWRVANAQRVRGALHSILHRQTYANLHDAYKAAELVIPVTSSGLTQQAWTKKVLFWAACPKFQDVYNLERDPRTRPLYNRFGHILEYSARWSMIRRTLGAGVFVLIPEAKISNHFIERTLTLPHLSIWMDLVQHFNPAIIQLSRTIHVALERLLAGQKPLKKRYVLEIYHRGQIRQCEDPKMLLDEVEEGLQTGTSNDGSRPASRPGLQPAEASPNAWLNEFMSFDSSALADTSMYL